MTNPDVVVFPQDPVASLPHGDLSHRLDITKSQLAAAYERACELLRGAEYALAENRLLSRAIKEAIRNRQSPAARQELPEYARVMARLQTMRVIEQAKGIIMAQSSCREAEAFDMLRRASQRSNVPVRELAARLVAKAAG